MKKTNTALTLAACMAGLAFGQGSLTPPGSPAPTMKTLDQIEARVDVATLSGNSNSVVVISQPGSYYLSSNLEILETYGILINATNVTLDLNGFNISRSSGSGGVGILINGGMDGATVRNGTLNGFDYGISSSGISGFGTGFLFEKLAVSGCDSGISAGYSSRLVDCRVYDNSGIGISVMSGSVLSGCTAYNNQDSGIFASSRCSLSDCAVIDNKGLYGIYAGADSTLKGCVADNNGSILLECYGIYAGDRSTVIDCTSSRNGAVSGMSGSSLSGVGIFGTQYVTIRNCTASGNNGDGIRVEHNCTVAENTAGENGQGVLYSYGSGIHTTGSDNRIDGNNVIGNDRGIDVDSTGSLIVRNSASGNSTQFSIAAGNDVGTIQTTPVGAGAWDNFEF